MSSSRAAFVYATDVAQSFSSACGCRAALKGLRYIYAADVAQSFSSAWRYRAALKGLRYI